MGGLALASQLWGWLVRKFRLVPEFPDRTYHQGEVSITGRTRIRVSGGSCEIWSYNGFPPTCQKNGATIGVATQNVDRDAVVGCWTQLSADAGTCGSAGLELHVMKSGAPTEIRRLVSSGPGLVSGFAIVSMEALTGDPGAPFGTPLIGFPTRPSDLARYLRQAEAELAKNTAQRAAGAAADLLEPVQLPLPVETPSVPGTIPLPVEVPGPFPGPGPVPSVVPSRPPLPSPVVPLPLPLPSPVPGPVVDPVEGLPVVPIPTPAPVPVTPPGVKPYPGGEVGGPGTTPPPTLPGIATEVGRIEQKMAIALDFLADGGGSGGEVDLGPVLDLLLAFYAGGSYEMQVPCSGSVDGTLPPAETVSWPGGAGAFEQLNAKLDAIASLLQIHKNQRQPVCRSRAQGQEVTVHFQEVSGG